MPEIEGWGEVPKRCKLMNFFHVFPTAPEYAEWVDDQKTNNEILQETRAVFYGWPKLIQTPYFNLEVTMHHPERCGTLDGRLKHLTHNNPPSKNHGISLQKCRWLPAVTTTLERPHAVLFDGKTGCHAFARRYRCKNLHLVFVKKITDQTTGAKSTVLISQFPYQEGELQDFLILDWKS